MATIHASTPSDAATRLETLSLMSGVDLPLHVARTQVAAALQIIVQINRFADGGRSVSHISQCLGMDERGSYRFEDLYRLQSVRDDSGGERRELRATGKRPFFAEQVDALGIRGQIERTRVIFLPATS